MKKQIAATILALGLPLGLMADEHPKEHPTGAEHPAAKESKGKEHPEHPAGSAHKQPVGSKHWIKKMNTEYTHAVENHVKQSKINGGFKVQDDKLSKEWDLDLLRVHKNKVVHLGNSQFFACADLKSTNQASKDKLDIDFYATKTDTGWKMDKVLIHKVNGQARYTYNDKNEMVLIDK